MDWTGNTRSFVSRHENTFSFLYNSNLDHYPGMELKYPVVADKVMQPVGIATESINLYGNQEKKKRLTSEQLESLERSFQEEIKLEPERKMKLARELELQPRQVAVWFQNRRARWKAKQLESLYDKLKLDYDAVYKEKQKLQDEVRKLKALLDEQEVLRPVSAGYTEFSREETVESTAVAVRRSEEQVGTSHHQIPECNYLFNIEHCNPVSCSYWDVLPAYP